MQWQKITQKSSVVAFLLWSFQKQNGLLKRSENNMKDIIGLSIAYWRDDELELNKEDKIFR